MTLQPCYSQYKNISIQLQMRSDSSHVIVDAGQEGSLD